MVTISNGNYRGESNVQFSDSNTYGKANVFVFITLMSFL